MCQQCERPQSTCLCDVLVRRDCGYQLIILQDPKESKHALSSAPLLAKSIADAQLIVGEVFDPVVVLGEDWRSDSLLVFPGERVISAEQSRGQIYRSLILLDGSWRKVARLVHLNPWLTELPCLAIDADNESQYRIRKSPRADGLSTIEAAVAALNALQPEQNYNDILAAFHKMIALQISAMGEDTYRKNYSGR